MNKRPIHVLVLCTGNSCRSIMGEAIVNALGEGRLHGHSAGSRPVGHIHPGAISTLARHGLATTGYHSKSMDTFHEQPMDILITVCDAAAQEPCPVFLGAAIHAHWGVEDPGKISGDEATVIEAFDRTFAILERRIQAMLDLPLETMNREDIARALAKIANIND